MELIKRHLGEIKKLCEAHYVKELYVFGSVLNDTFNKNSDVDFLVQFSNVDPLEYFDNYMDLKEKLEKLLSRKIDLVEKQTLKNPILKRSVDRNKVLLYGRKDTKITI